MTGNAMDKGGSFEIDPTKLNTPTLDRRINILAWLINDLEVELDKCVVEQERRELPGIIEA